MKQKKAKLSSGEKKEARRVKKATKADEDGEDGEGRHILYIVVVFWLHVCLLLVAVELSACFHRKGSKPQM